MYPFFCLLVYVEDMYYCLQNFTWTYQTKIDLMHVFSRVNIIHMSLLYNIISQHA